MRLTSRKVLSAMALSLSMATAASFFVDPHHAVAQQQPMAGNSSTGIITAVTEPSKRSQMNFPSMGIIKEVPVKEGQVVKKGDVLMIQDPDIEQAELERLKSEADSTARIAYYQAALDLKKKVYNRKSKAEGGVY